MTSPIRALPGPARAAARSLRHLPERVLHPWRRRRLLGWLLRQKPPHTVLFVCLGNVNRSPYAAAAFRRAAALRGGSAITVSSAGFIGPGRPSPVEARDAARARGLDLEGHASALIDYGQLVGAELVVVMDRRQRRRIRRLLHGAPGKVILLGDLDPEPIRRRAITDPHGSGAEVFDQVFARIDRCTDQLVRALVRPDEGEATDRESAAS